MNDHVEYHGRDLEAMSFVVNYHKWILNEFRPFLGKSLVEVGAGTGSFSELLIGEKIERLTLIEPSQMFRELSGQSIRGDRDVEINLEQALFAQVCAKVAVRDRPDSIIYVNVLEHIEDDLAELRMVHDTLVESGRCFIFVPAMMSLYGKFDERIGHYRRYSKLEIEHKCGQAGFKILLSKYFDLTGVFPWWIKYKLLRSDSLGSRAVTLYDKFAVPVTRLLESALRPPLGKNILLVCEKSGITT